MMIEPWFNANTYSWLPGTLFGVAGGLWGSVAGIFGSQGKAKAFVYGSGLVLALIGVGLFVVGMYGWTSGQPFFVWYGFLLPGVMALVSLTWAPFVVGRGYRVAEERRMQAQDARL